MGEAPSVSCMGIVVRGVNAGVTAVVVSPRNGLQGWTTRLVPVKRKNLAPRRPFGRGLVKPENGIATKCQESENISSRGKFRGGKRKQEDRDSS